MKSHRIVAVMCVVVMLTIAAAGWASGGRQASGPVAQPVAAGSAAPYLRNTSPVTLDWYIDESWYTRVQWGVDYASQYVTAKTGVTVNLIIPAGNEAERKNLMIASGDLPDFVSMGWWHPQAMQLEQSGLVWSLNELAEQYAPDFWNVTAPSVVSWYTREDGRIYGYPNVTEPPERLAEIQDKALINSYLGFLVRKDMWEAIGKPPMNTPEQFVRALELAKQRFPAVGGRPLIPLGMGEFTATGNLSLDDQLARLLNIQKAHDGRYNDIKVDPEYTRWLQALRTANEKGLLTTDIFVDKDPQIQEKIKQGRYFALIYARNSVAQSFNPILHQENPESIYITINGPQNSRMEKTELPVGSVAGWLISYISRNTRHPDRAIQFLHYLLSEEGQLDLYLGNPGQSRETLPDGTQRLIPTVSDLRATDEAGFCKLYGARDCYFFVLDPVITAPYNPPHPPWDLATRTWYRELNTIDVIANEYSLAPDTPAGTAWTDSQLKWGAVLPKLLLARTSADFDKLLAEFVAYDAKNRQVYASEIERAIAANLVRLGRNR